MGELCHFPSPVNVGEVRAPVFSDPSGEYAELIIPDSSHGTFREGTRLLIHLGATISGHAHALHTEQGVELATLNFCGDQVRATFHNSRQEAVVVPRSELDIIGRVCEAYPYGDYSTRWVQWDESATQVDYRRPLIAARASS